MINHSTSSSAAGATAGDPGAVQSAVDRMRSEVERLVETAMNQGERALDKVGIKPPPRRSTWPAVDLTDAPDAVIVRVDLPGVQPGGVTVDLSGSVLTVSGTLPAFPPGPGAVAAQCERPNGAFSRTVSLPAAVDPAGVSAELKDGLLTVTLTKNAAAPSHSIPVNPTPAE